MYVRPLLTYTFLFTSKTESDKFSLSQMQSKLDVLNIYPRRKLNASPRFQVTGGSDVVRPTPVHVRPTPVRPTPVRPTPLRPTPLRVVLMQLSYTMYTA